MLSGGGRERGRVEAYTKGLREKKPMTGIGSEVAKWMIAKTEE